MQTKVFIEKAASNGNLRFFIEMKNALIVCNDPVNTQKKKKKIKIRYLFWVPTCQAPPNPLPTTQSLIFSFLWSAHSLTFLFFLFFFFIFGWTLSLLLQALLPAPPNHHFHHHFSGKITGKFLRTHKHLHILFLR